MTNKNLTKNNAGFSILELLIAMFIFVLTIITAVSIFASVSSTRQKSREIQRNMEDARTALDLMAKNMRMSTGLSEVGNTHQEIYMFNTSQGDCISYKFDSDNKLKISQIPSANSSNCSTIAYTYNPIISSDVSGSFSITPTLATAIPKRVGKATIVLTIDGTTTMQTTVSFRDYKEIIQ
ncbi:MAG: hypothetical protein A2271_01040 [Candidatus Moranbacteria bacterium RIFOXYA12_FULL_35_19]|nr:MAG: PilW [Candidatus Moranbacteria bacterium GW2011_GWF2_35_39]OGI32600.1 MAG: hypothetical protein A2489_02735 [Candidatus Moranbacteria bacterium RIFOXYC12_FULL_36_13]OGI32885.1 MAG: hypothetical protein A2343_02310 [Candidatus Moranbacteria bacterium RIFOXYB12_FULL_35_8]OGI36485.1 MAG: hypothetical protein A2271_01040 [Candidatus Moranbacteria bacterium RIFOXYA12_FULL_35_19]